jgi:hypothetical protein
MEQPGHASATVEVRWWWPRPVSDDLDGWYHSLGARGADAVRTDRYLLTGSRADRNIKARHGSTMEVKRRVTVARLGRVVPGIDGSLERWRKWPMTPAVVPVGTWATVRKHRRLREAGLNHHVQLTLASSRGYPQQLLQALARHRPSDRTARGGRLTRGSWEQSR